MKLRYIFHGVINFVYLLIYFSEWCVFVWQIVIKRNITKWKLIVIIKIFELLFCTT